MPSISYIAVNWFGILKITRSGWRTLSGGTRVTTRSWMCSMERSSHKLMNFIRRKGSGEESLLIKNVPLYRLPVTTSARASRKLKGHRSSVSAWFATRQWTPRKYFDSLSVAAWSAFVYGRRESSGVAADVCERNRLIDWMDDSE